MHPFVETRKTVTRVQALRIKDSRRNYGHAIQFSTRALRVSKIIPNVFQRFVFVFLYTLTENNVCQRINAVSTALETHSLTGTGTFIISLSFALFFQQVHRLPPNGSKAHKNFTLSLVPETGRSRKANVRTEISCHPNRSFGLNLYLEAYKEILLQLQFQCSETECQKNRCGRGQGRRERERRVR